MIIKRPKLKDKLYGEMVWEELDDYEYGWYARITAETGADFELFIMVDSQADFLAVRGTHAIYQKLINNIHSIRDEMIEDLLENSLSLTKNKRQRKLLGERIKKTLRLFSIKIFYDLSSTILFVDDVGADKEPDDAFYVLLDNNGDFLESGLEDL